MRTTRFIGSLVCSLLLVACGGNGGDGKKNNGGPDAAPAQTVSIQDIQDDAMATGTSVKVEDVVVTAIDGYGGRTGAIYVEEPEGGAYSGVVVNTSAVPSGVEVGSIVTVTGFKDEFALQEDMTGQTVTQIGSPTVTVTGSGEVPAAEVVDPRDLVDPLEAEKWEGVLITVENVRFESVPHGVTDTDELLLEGKITGPFLVQSALTAFPDGIAYRDCFSSITGIGDYFFDYKILPRSAADIVAAGDDGACPAEESLCDNTLDDDADGYSDCEDYACYAADLAAVSNVCADDETVIGVQNDSVEVDSIVEIAGVVTAENHDDRDEFWIQTDGAAATGAAADDDGLHVELFKQVLPGGKLDDDDIKVGRKVTVVGTVLSSYGETVLANAAIIDGEADATPVARTDAVLADVADPDTGKIYEGRLVTFTNVEVTDVANFDTYGQVEIGGALTVDDSLYSYKAEGDWTPAANDCMASITGIVLLDTFDPAHYYLAPRSPDDIEATGGTCL